MSHDTLPMIHEGAADEAGGAPIVATAAVYAEIAAEIGNMIGESMPLSETDLHTRSL
jgi:hypothetical protein